MSEGLKALKDLRTHVYAKNEDIFSRYDIIEKELKELEIIKKFVWLENGEIVLRENDFESKEEYDLLKKIRGLKLWKYLCENGHVDIHMPKMK